jgi:hypothetical protein
MKKSSTSLFLQKKMKCLIISSNKNEVLHYEVLHFFLKKYWGTSFFYEGIIRRFCFFSEEIMRRLKIFWRKKWGASLFLQKKKFMFFCRTNEVLRLVTPRNLLMLFLQWKKSSIHYFFRKNSSTSLFLQKKNSIFFERITRPLILFWSNNEAHDFFW